MNEQFALINTIIPDSIKIAIQRHQTHKVAAQLQGTTDFSFAKIAEQIGMKMAARNLKWRPIFDGLKALQTLEN
jgi:hypothetical protein